MIAFRQVAANGLLALGMRRIARGSWRAFMATLASPERAQTGVLRAIMARNAETAFGRRHGFAKVRTWSDFRAAIDVQTYDTLEPWIMTQAMGGELTVSPETPILYARTSGTTGKPKYVPLTRRGLAAQRTLQSLFAYAQYRGTGIYRGRILGIGSPAIEGHIREGVPYGSTTGLIYRTMPWPVRTKYVLPAEIFSIADYADRYLAITILAAATRNISAIATANPSTLLKLLDLANERRDDIVDAIRHGRWPGAARPAGFEPIADPRRADELAGLARGDGGWSFATLWPRLQGLVVWTGGSCGVALGALQRHLSDRTRIVEVGYVASELRGTVNIDAINNRCAPTLAHNLFEFVAQDDWEAGRRNFRCLWELEQGGRYYVFVTTPDGLYRYDMNDILEVTGFEGPTPTLKFLRKGRGVTSITGEKLSEDQATEAVRRVAADLGVDVGFYLFLADEVAARYRILAEFRQRPPSMAQFTDAIDARLCELNVEYEAKRRSGRLGPPDSQALRPGAGDAYRRFCVAQGQRDGQFKMLLVQYARDCAFDFAAEALPAA